LSPKKHLFLKLRYKKNIKEKIRTKEISTKTPLYINTKNKKIEYKPDCKLMPSNILKALINNKKHKIVKIIDIL